MPQWVPKSSADQEEESAAQEEEEKPRRGRREEGGEGKGRKGGKGKGEASGGAGGKSAGKDKGKSGGQDHEDGYAKGAGGGKDGKRGGKEPRDAGGKDKGGFRGNDGKDGYGKGGGKGGKKGEEKGRWSDDWGGGRKGGRGGRDDDDDYDEGGRKGGKGKKGSKGCKDSFEGKGGAEKSDRPVRSEDARRQVLVEKGQHAEVKKHSSMGCAVVTLDDARVRQAVLAMLGTETTINGVNVKLKAQKDKETGEEVPTDIFVGWGRQAEKATPLAETEIVKFFDQMCNQATGGAPRMPGAAAPAARPLAMFPGVAPPVMAGTPGMHPGAPTAMSPQAAAYTQQAAAQQYARAQQAAAAQMQYQQYFQYQQQQQAMAYQQYAAMCASQTQQTAAYGQKGSAPREYKAAYRHPSDEEVKMALSRFTGAPQPPAAAPSTG